MSVMSAEALLASLMAQAEGRGVDLITLRALVEESSQAGARRALASLETNLESLGLERRATVWRIELPKGLKRMRPALERADIVLLDPPYGGAEARQALQVLSESAVLRPGCRVVLEHHSKDEVPAVAGQLECTEQRKYGETQITFYGPRTKEPARAEEPSA